MARNEQGFTLIELLIAMAMTGILLGPIWSFFIVQRQSHAAQEQMTRMVQGARAAMDMMGYEVRMAGYNPARATLMGITYSASQLQIKADFDGNGTTTGADENLIYTFDATNRRILRNTGTGDEIYAQNIQAFTFEYLDASGAPTTTSASIRQLRLTITARTGTPDPHYASNGGYRTYTLTSFIIPRNLAYP
jgi:type IV pilus assembly protein PilW